MCIPGLVKVFPKFSRAKKEKSAKEPIYQTQLTSGSVRHSEVAQNDDPPKPTGDIAPPPPELEATSATSSNRDSYEGQTACIAKPCSVYWDSHRDSRGDRFPCFGSCVEQRLFGRALKIDQPADTSSESDIFMVVTWSIVLCKIVSPFGIAWLVRRVKHLEKEREASGAEKGVPGVWRVQ